MRLVSHGVDCPMYSVTKNRGKTARSNRGKNRDITAVRPLACLSMQTHVRNGKSSIICLMKLLVR